MPGNLAASPNGLAVYAPGYWVDLWPASVSAAQKAFATVNFTQAEFDQLKQICLNGRTAVDSELAALPTQIPVTVQGASEQFITNTMGQVVANTNQNAVLLNGSIFTARDQVKTHVTTEADRVIAAG